MLACAFMTILVPKVAGVDTVIACTPPRGGDFHAPTLHAIATSGADRIFALGGVQALAAMAFGLLDAELGAVDMLVGPGNAFVAEAKRQLFGRVGIDLLAGPSEVAVIADHSADPELVAADLLAQAEHGPTSPAVLITTSEELGRAVIDQVDSSSSTRSTRSAAGAGDTPRTRLDRLRHGDAGLRPRARRPALRRRRHRAPRGPHHRGRLVPPAPAQLRLAVPRPAARRSRSRTRRSEPTTRSRPVTLRATRAACRWRSS